LKQPGLVSFDDEVIVGFAFMDQVMGQLALCEQGVGGDVFSLDIDGIKQRNGRLDLVGLLGFFTTLQGQGPYFFWV
jgi:hypothetical protein